MSKAGAKFRVFLDNSPAEEERLELIGKIRIDQAIGMAAEAEFHLGLSVDDQGRWSEMEEDYVQPFARVRVEVRAGDGDFEPLIDGPVVGQRFELKAGPGESQAVLVVQDDSVLLNQDEEVELYENLAPHEIAETLFQQYGLVPETDRVETPAGGPSRFLVRRGTAMQFLRELARRHGMFVYVEPGEEPGTSTGLFKRLDLSRADYPELLLLGAERNLSSFSAEFDGLRPLTARAASVDITNQEILESETAESDLEPKGDIAVHELLTAGQTLLARTRETTVDLDAATGAAVDYSSWAYSASAEVDASSYTGILRPHRVVSVAGLGAHLSGDWLVSQVTHSIDDGGYRQQFKLRRNARSDGANGSGLPGGVF